MKIELLVLKDCPNRASARALLEDCLADIGSDSEILEIEVDTSEQVRLLAFPGSPTMRVDGTDVEPGFLTLETGMACRVYQRGGRLHPLPDRTLVIEALRRAQDTDSHACCSPGKASIEQTRCPSCGTVGRIVKSVTLRAILHPSLREQVLEEAYRFCSDPACKVVYFSPDGSQIFTKSDLTIRVGFKERDAPHTICYCFDHSVESIKEEWLVRGHTTAVEYIRSQIKAGACRCEVANPAGTCCLGEVIKVVKEIAGQDASCCRGGDDV